MVNEITLLTVYDKVSTVENKIDTHIARVDERLDSGGRQIADHEKRIRWLEQAKWKATGAASVAGMVAGTVASTIIYHVWH